MTDYVAVLHNMALNQRQRDAESELANPLINTARLLAGAAEHMKRLEAENRRLREALEQCLGNLKALGAENGWGAEAARAALSPRPVTPAGNIAGTLEVTDVGGSVGSLLSAAGRELRRLDRIELELKAENAALRRERDDALRAAWAVRDLATPPVSDEDVERAVAEAKRVSQEIEGEH